MVAQAAPAIKPQTTSSVATADVKAEMNTSPPAGSFRQVARLGSSLLVVSAVTIAALVAILFLL